jgi:hypothetical protein
LSLLALGTSVEAKLRQRLLREVLSTNALIE